MKAMKRGQQQLVRCKLEHQSSLHSSRVYEHTHEVLGRGGSGQRVEGWQSGTRGPCRRSVGGYKGEGRRTAVGGLKPMNPIWRLRDRSAQLSC